jgi:hypothetical protein
MDDVGVKNTTTFENFRCEGNGDYIKWIILKEGAQDGSQFSKDIN